jgi:hypothetical protein
MFKGIGSILFLKNGWKKICRKKQKPSQRSNNYEVCTAVAHCFPNILDAIVLENIKKGERHCGLMKQSCISVISHLYTVSGVYISTTL